MTQARLVGLIDTVLFSYILTARMNIHNMQRESCIKIVIKIVIIFTHSDCLYEYL